jgi:F0F1-type ATP synthase alpha subunit
LAKYRELAAFSQFASDLDETTKRELRRGERLTELLKQGQYQPVPAEQQVIQILAGVEDLIIDLPVNQVRPFINAMTEHFVNVKGDLLTEVREKADLGKKVNDAYPAETLGGRLISTIQAFKATWNG